MTRRDSVRDRRECFDRCRRADHLGRIVLDCHLCDGPPIQPASEEWECDHVTPFAHGGVRTLPAHPRCHRKKTSEVDIPAIAKGKRVRDRTFGIKKTAGTMPGSRGSKWKKKMSGEVVRRDAE